MTRKLVLLISLFVALASGNADASPPDAADDDCRWSTLGPLDLSVSVARHGWFQRRGKAELAERVGVRPETALAYKKGPLAVIEGDALLVPPPNLFDLAGQGVRFRPSANGYVAEEASAAFDPAVGGRVELGDDDEVVLKIKGWQFPFYGESWSRLYINSNGSLTFGQSSPRSYADLRSFHLGPPRIAAFQADLDPSVTSGSTGIFARSTSNWVKVTWLGVPEWGKEEGTSVQVTLYPDGVVEMVFGEVAGENAIVGITPGVGESLELVDLGSDLPTDPVDGGIAEQFSSQYEYDELGVAQTFLEHFQDRYDLIVIYLDFPHRLMGGAANAFHQTLINDVRGIGRSLYDYSASAGSDGELEGLVHMGSTDVYPKNPKQIFRHIHNSLSILTHEVSHRWLVNASFVDGDGVVRSDHRGEVVSSHWSFFFDSDNSVMLGNDLQDNGDGSFTTLGGPRRLNDLDLYLMGLLPPEEVSDTFLVANGEGGEPDSKPLAGLTLTGDRVDVSIDQVVAAEGPRDPFYEDSQKHFNIAFVLLTADGRSPSKDGYKKVKKIRKQWVKYFEDLTHKVATVDTSIRSR